MEARGSTSTSWCNGHLQAVTLEDVDSMLHLDLDGDNSSASKMNRFRDLARIMKKVAKRYVIQRRHVKTRYGVPAAPDPDPDRSLHLKDPRVMKRFRATEESNRQLAQHKKQRRQECEDAVLRGIIPRYVKRIDDAFNSNKSHSECTPVPRVPFEVKFLEGCREELSKPPFDEKSHYLPPDVIKKSLRSEDIAAAALGLAFFNTKFSNQPPYFLEEVYGYHVHQHGAIHWRHCNFRARQRRGSPSMLFFVELYFSSIVTFCCIVDGIPQKRGCLNCPEHFVHPEEGGFLHGIHLNMDEDQNARLAVSSGFIHGCLKSKPCHHG